MTTPDYFLPEQFCNSGVQSIDYVIPPISSADPAAASLETGAPPLQQVRPSLGGAAFPRQQYNGALRLLSNILTYLNKGGEFTFDPKNTAGYALGAVLYDYASKRYVVSLHDANTANFVTNLTLINGTDWAFISVTPAMLDIYAKLSSPAFTDTPTAPTAALETNTIQLATTAFAYNLKGNFKTVVSINATSTLSVTDMGKVIENVATAPNINLILPNVSTVPSGSVVGLYNVSTYSMTISTQAGQIINNGTQHAATIAIPSGGSCILYTDQTSWTMIALGGSMVATPADVAVLVGQISTLTNQQFGISQNWQNYDVVTVRQWNITYTNTTNKAIVVQVQGTSTTASPIISPIVNGVAIASNGGGANPGQLMFNITVVPPGQTYQMQASNVVLNRWSELR